MAKAEKLTEEELNDVVQGFVVRQLRSISGGHDDLFERGLRIFQLLEQELGGEGDELGSRLEALLNHPFATPVLALAPQSARKVAENAVEAMEDNRRILRRLVDGPPIKTRERAEERYREELVAEVTRERSLENLDSIANAASLAHRLLASKRFIARKVRARGFSLLQRVLVKTEDTRRELAELYADLEMDPTELSHLARTIREHGPDLVNAIYGE